MAGFPMINQMLHYGVFKARIESVIYKSDYSRVYLLIQDSGNKAVAKCEKVLPMRRSNLKFEVLALRATKDLSFFQDFYGSCAVGNYRFVLLEHLGLDLISLKLSLPNESFTKMAAIRLVLTSLSRIQTLHEIGFQHRDVKPSNFLIGLGFNASCVYLIDFGSSKKYRNSKDQLQPERPRVHSIGTFRYMSIRSHTKEDQHRGSDLESWFYMILELYAGELPWKTSHILEDIRQAKEQLYQHRNFSFITGYSQGFYDICKQITELKFGDCPDYLVIMSYLLSISRPIGNINEHQYEWVTKVPTRIISSDQSLDKQTFPVNESSTSDKGKIAVERVLNLSFLSREKIVYFFEKCRLLRTHQFKQRELTESEDAGVFNALSSRHLVLDVFLEFLAIIRKYLFSDRMITYNKTWTILKKTYQAESCRESCIIGMVDWLFGDLVFSKFVCYDMGGILYSPPLEQIIADGKVDSRSIEKKFREIFDPIKAVGNPEYYNYFLISPVVLGDYDGGDIELKKFVSSVIYVGKGSSARPLQHLIQAMEFSDSEKVKRIQEIFTAGRGVVICQIFQLTSEDESYSRETCMIEAFNKANLTNIQSGHDMTKHFTRQEMMVLGAVMVKRAWMQFMATEYKEIYPQQLTEGCICK